MTKPRFKSRIAASLHEMADMLHHADAIGDAEMVRYGRLCLVPVPEVNPSQIRSLRTGHGVSQADFAYHLNVTPGLVSQWERGEKKPSGPSLKLLDIVARKGLEAII